MAETREEKEQRERQERERHERLQRQSSERDRQKSDSSKEGEEKVGNPMREDDRQNQFRAPDDKPQGAIYGEDLTQAGPGQTEEEIEAPPEGTHPQKPSAQPKEEGEHHHSRR